MAYNMLKGAVEGSVDQYGDQEIDGVKVFKNTISASVFYDTDAQSPCATLKEVPIRKLQGGSKGAVITFQEGHTVKAEYGLRFDGQTLETKKVSAISFHGSAEGLANIPASNLVGNVNLDSIKLGASLYKTSNGIQVNPGNGLQNDQHGVSLCLSANSGLDADSGQLLISHKRCEDITARGQNLSDDDLLMVHDSSRGDLRRTTLKNFCDSYLKSKTLHPDGPVSAVQLRGKKGLAASNAFSFDVKSSTLKVEGKTLTDNLHVIKDAFFDSMVVHRSAIAGNIITVSDPIYQVKDADYTILADTTKNIMTVTLPPATDWKGRIITIKKINTDSYKLNSNSLTIESELGKIDNRDHASVKMVNSVVVVQSDGKNWFIINKTGS